MKNASARVPCALQNRKTPKNAWFSFCLPYKPIGGLFTVLRNSHGRCCTSVAGYPSAVSKGNSRTIHFLGSREIPTCLCHKHSSACEVPVPLYGTDIIQEAPVWVWHLFSSNPRIMDRLGGDLRQLGSALHMLLRMQKPCLLSGVYKFAGTCNVRKAKAM